MSQINQAALLNFELHEMKRASIIGALSTGKLDIEWLILKATYPLYGILY